jgi:hypothetical protein
MALKIKPKRSSTASNVPSTSNLDAGEIAINLADKKLYVRDTNSNILELTTRTVSSLDDINLSSVASGQVLIYNSSNSSWENGNGVATIADGAVTTVKIAAGAITMAKIASGVWSGFDTNIIPDTDNIRSLGSATKQWKDVFIGPGTLHANGIPQSFNTGFSINPTNDVISTDITVKNGYTASRSGTGKIGASVTVTLETGSFMAIS